jgi:hypothetical protein
MPVQAQGTCLAVGCAVGLVAPSVMPGWCDVAALVFCRVTQWCLTWAGTTNSTNPHE